jgi:hypothetical protein
MGEVSEQNLNSYQGTDVHEDEEQYKDHDDHHYEVGPAHAFYIPFDRVLDSTTILSFSQANRQSF